MKNLILTASVCLLILSCAEKKPEDFTEDKALFEYATRLYKDNSMTQAITFFESLKNRFPQSPFAQESELKIADAYFEKGDYIEAEVMYRNFRTLHPAHLKIPYAVYRMGLSQYKRKPKSIDRDQTEGQNALTTFRELLNGWPNSDEAKEAKTYVEKCERDLIEREIYVGNFYFQKKKYSAAATRFKNAAKSETFDDLKMKAKYRLGETYLELKDAENAKNVLAEVAAIKNNYQSKAQQLLHQLR